MRSKKMPVVFLAALLIIALIGGCNSPATTKPTTTAPAQTTTAATTTSAEPAVVNGTYVEGLPIAAEAKTLKVLVVRQPSDQSSSTAIKPFVVRSVQDTGLQFEWTDLPSTDAATQISVILASGNLPDVFLGGINAPIITSNFDLFAQLDELLPVYAPNVMQFYTENNIQWEEYLRYSDNHVYSLLGGIYSNYQGLTDGVGFINQKWLEKANLKKPTTTEEFYQVLKAFKDLDVDGDGNADNEIPVDFADNYWASGITNYLGIWGIAGNYNINDGKVVNTVDTEAYREYLKYMNKLYSEKLINMEGFSQTGEQYVATIKAMKVGVFYAWGPQTYLGMSADAEQYTNLGKITVPGYEKDFVHYANPKVSANTNAFTISASSKNKEAALRWWDYLSSTDELRWLTARGIEGYVYERDPDGTMYLVSPSKEELEAIIKKNNLAAEYNASMSNASFYLDGFHPLLMSNYLYRAPKAGEFATQGYAREKAIDAIYEYLADAVPRNRIVPKDAQEKFDFECEGLEDYINIFRTESIMNGVTDQSWAEYLKQLKSYNYEYYLNFYQMKYDGVFE